MSLNNLKNLPGVKTLIRPMLWLSLSVHGLLLMLPIATETEAKSSPLKQESVKITQLPIPPTPKPPSVVPTPKPTTVIQQNPISSTPPQVKTLPTRLNPIIESPKPSSTVQKNLATPTPVAILPTPTAVASPTPTPTPTTVTSPTPIPTPTTVASPTPTPTPTTVASPTPAPTPTTVTSPTPAPTPVTATPTPNEIAAGVPNYENARRSCNGFCWQIKQTPFRTVSTTLKKRFEDQGYTVEKQEIADDIGRSVYAVSKDGKTQYLNVLSKVNGDAVYLLAEKELTPEEITQKQAF